MKLKRSHDAAGNARLLLPKMAAKYFKAGREAARTNRSPRELHRFRLETKRFRYSLELFRPVYGPGLDRQLAALREVQGVLGKLSDYHSVHTLLKGDKELKAKLRHAAQKTWKEFRRRWEAFDSPGQLKRWKAYLARGPVKTRNRAPSVSAGTMPL